MASCASSPDVASSSSRSETDAGLDRLQAWLSGSFSSARQAVEDPRYFEIHLRAAPIWTDRTDGRWLYIEQAQGQRLDSPYLQRGYHLTSEGDGAFMSTIYTLPGDALTFAGAWRTPGEFDELSPDDLAIRDGCEITLSWDDGVERFTGSTTGSGCESSLSGASYATAEVEITADEMRSWDRGFNADGEQVWGAEAGAYIFRRIDAE